MGHHRSSSCTSAGRMFAIRIGDIDNFKSIYDWNEHDSGDRILVRTANHLQNALRPQDVTARRSGEEVSVPASRHRPQGCHNTGRANPEHGWRPPLHLDAKADITLSMTIGVSTYRGDENSYTCISRADQAIYQGKATGKNRVVTAE